MIDNTRNPHTIFERIFGTEDLANLYLASLLGSGGEPMCAEVYTEKLHQVTRLKEFFMTTAYAHPQRDSFLEIIAGVEDILRREFAEMEGNVHREKAKKQ